MSALFCFLLSTINLVVGIVGSICRCGVPRWKEPSTILPRTSSGSHRRAGALVRQLSPNSWATLARWVWCLGVWWQWSLTVV